MSSIWRGNISQTDLEIKGHHRYDTPRTLLALLVTLLSAGAVTWLLGRLCKNTTAGLDAIMLAILSLFFCRHDILSVGHESLGLLSAAWLYLTPLLLVNSFQVAFLAGRRVSDPSSKEHDYSSPLKPRIFPASTSHTRMFPRHHSFKYSYLLVGVPVGSVGRIGRLISWDSARRSSWWKDGWFSVHASDYLAYSCEPTSPLDKGPENVAQPPSLRQKLDTYLRTQGIIPSGYPHAYLVTAPRVLGLGFNPVSFWYLYDHTVRLAAMILEVNNTFGERRMYFMQNAGSQQQDTEELQLAAMPIDKKMQKFKSKWKKDFHVSPFNDREGEYSLAALDPFLEVHDGNAKINNIITLSSPVYTTPHPPVEVTTESPLSQAKVIASITSSAPALDPFTTSNLQSTIFLFKWAWLGFLTNPRILREARVLWVKGLKVWFRPEVYNTTLGRAETEEESVLERYFRGWLQDLCKRCEKRGSRVGIRYTPAAGDRGQVIKLSNDEDGTVLEIKVLTPAFYAELARGANLRAVWQQRCFSTEAGAAMVHTNDPGALKTAIDDYMTALEKSNIQCAPKTYIARLSENLRNGHGLIEALVTTLAQTLLNKNETVTTPSTVLSFADTLTPLPTSEQLLTEFQHTSLKVLLADRIALGSTALLRFYRFFCRMAVIYIAAGQVSSLVTESVGTSVLWKPDTTLRVMKMIGLSMGVTLVGRAID